MRVAIGPTISDWTRVREVKLESNEVSCIPMSVVRESAVARFDSKLAEDRTSWSSTETYDWMRKLQRSIMRSEQRMPREVQMIVSEEHGTMLGCIS